MSTTTNNNNVYLIIAAVISLIFITGISTCAGVSDAQVEDNVTSGTSSESHTTIPGSVTFLNVITKVDNTNGGAKKPSDFTLSVSGNSPSPKSFSGSSSGTSVTLNAGQYRVIQESSSTSDYTTSYSSGCSGTANGGTPIKCTISNQYHARPIPSPTPLPTPSPTPPPVPNKSSNIVITTNSISIYSIPSTSVQIDRFSTNYTMAGTISSLNDSKDLITSTIINDFDKNPNIGYVVNSSSGSSQNPSTTPPTSSHQTQPGIPNPFVNTDMINQRITNEIQDAIGANTASSINSPEKHIEIKCTFGMILADYNCS